MATMGGLGHPGWSQPPPQQYGGGPPLPPPPSAASHVMNTSGMSRSSSNGALDGPPPAASVITLRPLLSGEEVQYLFGAKEQLVEQLRQQTGAGITLSEPGAHERVLTLTGPLDIVFKAFSLVCRKLWELVSGGLPDGGSRLLVLRLAVPAAQCGSIIGKAGAKIKEIRELTGANMNVGQESLPESNERTVEIIGSGESCLQTVYQVCCVLQDTPLKSEVIPYYPRALIAELPPPQVAGPAAALKPIFLTAHRAYTIENGMAVPASPERLKNEMELILGTQLGPLGGFDAALGGGATPIPEYMNPVALLAVLAQPHKLGGAVGGGSGVPEISREMRIENEVAGSVIGRLGSKVAEIRKLSGAYVSVNTADEVTEAGERIVSIRGSPESVMLAQFLVQSNIDLYKKDLGMKAGGGGDFVGGGGGGMMDGPPPMMMPPSLPPGHTDGGGFDFGDQMMDPAGHRGFVFGRGGGAGPGGGGPPPPYGGRGSSSGVRGGGMFSRGGRGSPIDGGRRGAMVGGHIGGLRGRGRRR